LQGDGGGQEKHEPILVHESHFCEPLVIFRHQVGGIMLR